MGGAVSIIASRDRTSREIRSLTRQWIRRRLYVPLILCIAVQLRWNQMPSLGYWFIAPAKASFENRTWRQEVCVGDKAIAEKLELSVHHLVKFRLLEPKQRWKIL